jgi:small conductance mechanosensitive channel
MARLRIVNAHLLTSAASPNTAAEAARLPPYVRQHSHWIIEVPVRILVIIVATVVLRAVLHRLINRLVRPAAIAGVRVSGVAVERRAARAATIASVMRSAVSLTLLVIATLTIFAELGIDLAPFIAGTSVVGVALGFGAQNIVKDFLSGIFMTLEDQYGVGDVIDFEKATGTVEAVGLRTTRLRDVNGTVWYVRNGEVVRVGNKSQGYAQVVLDVPIPADADIEAAASTMLRVARAMRDEPDWQPVFLAEPEMQGVEGLTLEQTVLRLVTRVRAGDQWRVARELRRRVREQLGVDPTPPVST